MSNSLSGLLRICSSIPLSMALAALFFSAQAFAEVAYVTDMLQLSLYETKAMTGPPIRRLRSGDRLEVLQRNGSYANVRATDDQVGWVKSLYLVEAEPARARINKLEADNSRLESTLNTLQAQRTEEQLSYKKLLAEFDGTEKLRAENADLSDKLSAYSNSVPLIWLFVVLVLALIGGFAGGWFWVDRQSRAKHGGYRIY